MCGKYSFMIIIPLRLRTWLFVADLRYVRVATPLQRGAELFCAVQAVLCACVSAH